MVSECVCKPSSECEDVRMRRCAYVYLFALCTLWAEPRLSQHACKAERWRGRREKKKCWVLDAKKKCHICPCGVGACAPVFMCAWMYCMRVLGTCAITVQPFLRLRTAKCWWMLDAKLTQAIPSPMFCTAKRAQQGSKSRPNIKWLQVLGTEAEGRPMVGRTHPKNRGQLRGSQTTWCKKDFNELSCEADVQKSSPAAPLASEPTERYGRPTGGTLISSLMFPNLNGWN